MGRALSLNLWYDNFAARWQSYERNFVLEIIQFILKIDNDHDLVQFGIKAICYKIDFLDSYVFL